MDYRGTSEKGEVGIYRPWNKLSPSFAENEEFPFIAIPVERDITTIVGANESGKSHLLNAIAKVIRGSGTDPQDEFKRTDLCHYASVRTKNAEAWPNIGLEFTMENKAERQQLNGLVGASVAVSDEPVRFALLLAPDRNQQTPAYLFVHPDQTAKPLNEEQLKQVRALLPSVQFIDSNAQLPSELPLADLLAAYGAEGFSNINLTDRRAVEEAASRIRSLPVLTAGQAVSADFTKQLDELRSTLSSRPRNSGTKTLEVNLFKEILEINPDALEHLYNLTIAERGYIEGQIATWNDAITERLNLAHFWKQDENFSLTINFKDGVLYFEIRDKTGSVYTFKERSSGLKFFLSYYVQAKAMEMTHRNRNSIILMDEPDAALSIAGQRNLLAVFESLVSPESSGQSCQLIYSTHSPYLINRNFARRIRVVKKEDAEEGTQHIEQARTRRYEPVRTALGVDSAPSLFLGADNILLEGPTDQYIIAELIRIFATPENVGNFLDLNMVVTVSADGVTNIPNVLEQSRWADEPIPPTVVIVDADRQGQEVINNITGRTQGCRRLVDDELAKTIADLITPFGDNYAIVTTEDIIPKAIYTEAIRLYMKHWLPETWKANATAIDTELNGVDYGKSNGLAQATKALFEKHQPAFNGDFDKMGIYQEVIAIIAAQAEDNAGREQSRKSLIDLCAFIRDGLIRSRSKTLRHSATQAMKRIVRDFQRLHKQNVSIPAVQELFARLQRELGPIGSDGEQCLAVLTSYLSELERLRTAGQDRLASEEWKTWERRLDLIKKNPLTLHTDASAEQRGATTGA